MFSRAMIAVCLLSVLLFNAGVQTAGAFSVVASGKGADVCKLDTESDCPHEVCPMKEQKRAEHVKAFVAGKGDGAPSVSCIVICAELDEPYPLNTVVEAVLISSFEGFLPQGSAENLPEGEDSLLKDISSCPERPPRS